MADLAVTKSDSPTRCSSASSSPHRGDPEQRAVHRYLSLAQRHTAGGRDLRLRDSLAGQLLPVGGTVTCPVGTIANGASASVQINVTPQSTGSITNQATASSSVTDTNSANNTASATTTVNPAADLALPKSDSPDPVRQGQQLVYTRRQQLGASSAAAVTLSDTLPSGVTFNSATASQGSCGQAAGVVTCVFGTIASGGLTPRSPSHRPTRARSRTLPACRPARATRTR